MLSSTSRLVSRGNPLASYTRTGNDESELGENTPPAPPIAANPDPSRFLSPTVHEVLPIGLNPLPVMVTLVVELLEPGGAQLGLMLAMVGPAASALLTGIRTVTRLAAVSAEASLFIRAFP